MYSIVNRVLTLLDAGQGDDKTYPGPNGGSHGVHTASTAGGILVNTTYAGLDLAVAGVAPGAYIMNYRISYPGIKGGFGFGSAEV